MSAAPVSFFARYHDFRMAAAALRRCWPQRFGRRDPMRQAQFLRSNTFHWAFLVAAVFAVFIIVLFGFIYWKIDDYLTVRSDRVITAQMDRIADLPAERRLEAIEERLRQDPR